MLAKSVGQMGVARKPAFQHNIEKPEWALMHELPRTLETQTKNVLIRR
jgi:hypothetical protein